MSVGKNHLDPSTPGHGHTQLEFGGPRYVFPSWYIRLKRAATLIIAALLAIAILAFAASYWRPNTLFLSVGSAALAIVLWPLRRMNHPDELVSPWMFIIGIVTVGLFGRGLYVAIGRPNAADLDALYLRGQDIGFFLYPSMLLLIGLIFLNLGFFHTRKLSLVTHQRRLRESLLPSRINDFFARFAALDARRVHAVVALLALVSFFAFIQYVLNTGGLESDDISAKRAISPGLDVPEEFRGHHYLRFVADLGGIAYLTLLAYYCVNRYRLLHYRSLGLLALFLNASLLPFYASSRSAVLSLIVLTPAVLYYAGYRIRKRHLLVGLLAVLLVMQVMTALRQQPRTADEGTLFTTSPTHLVDTMVMNRNLLDVFKTAHVIRNVPEALGFAYGETIYKWALGVIPRELWAGKPSLSAGSEVGILVYGTRRSGIPPGFVAELYWNFHVPGIIMGSFLIGLGLRMVHERFCPRRTRNIGLILLYCYALMRSGMLVGSAVGQGLFNAVLGVVAVSVVLILLTLGRPRRAW